MKNISMIAKVLTFLLFEYTLSFDFGHIFEEAFGGGGGGGFQFEFQGGMGGRQAPRVCTIVY